MHHINRLKDKTAWGSRATWPEHCLWNQLHRLLHQLHTSSVAWSRASQKSLCLFPHGLALRIALVDYKALRTVPDTKWVRVKYFPFILFFFKLLNLLKIMKIITSLTQIIFATVPQVSQLTYSNLLSLYAVEMTFENDRCFQRLK